MGTQPVPGSGRQPVSACSAVGLLILLVTPAPVRAQPSGGPDGPVPHQAELASLQELRRYELARPVLGWPAAQPRTPGAYPLSPTAPPRGDKRRLVK